MRPREHNKLGGQNGFFSREIIIIYLPQPVNLIHNLSGCIFSMPQPVNLIHNLSCLIQSTL